MTVDLFLLVVECIVLDYIYVSKCAEQLHTVIV